MKNTLIKIYTALILSAPVFAIICTVDKIPKNDDCTQCENHLETPSGFIEESISSFMEFMTKSKQNKKTLDSLKDTELFLTKEENLQRCSNYASVKNSFSNNFQKHLKACEEGSKILNNNKQLCEWVFEKYINTIEGRFYNTYARVDAKGMAWEVPGAIEKLETPMRSHLKWCNGVKKSYDNKIYINCSKTEENIAGLERTRKIHESMKRDLESSANPPKPELTLDQQRQENLKEACKYFDNHPITKISEDFFLKCI